MSGKMTNNDVRWCYYMASTLANDAAFGHRQETVRYAHTSRTNALALKQFCSGFADITLIQQNPETPLDEPQSWEIQVKYKNPSDFE